MQHTWHRQDTHRDESMRGDAIAMTPIDHMQVGSLNNPCNQWAGPICLYLLIDLTDIGCPPAVGLAVGQCAWLLPGPLSGARPAHGRSNAHASHAPHAARTGQL
jgi:hypothetical protein